MNATTARFVRAHAFALAFAAYACGVIASDAISSIWRGAAIVAACAGAVAWASSSKRSAELRMFLVAVACGFTLGALSGSFACRIARAPRFAPLDEHHIRALVVVTERPKTSASGLSARVRVERVTAPQGEAPEALRGALVVLEFPQVRHADDLAGREVDVRAQLSLPGGPRNDGEPAESDILADQGVVATLRAPSTGDLVVKAPARGLDAWWARLRAGCARTIEARLPPLEATVLEGILWGDRNDLPAALRQEFSDTGMVHVLTTAGLHLGMFAALMSWLFARLPLPRYLRAALVVACAWGYAGLAGLHLPTIRAATMLTVGTVGYELGRGRSMSAILAAAAFAVALPHPLVLLSPSFAMSFACVGGIALVGPALQRFGLDGDGEGGHHITELARTSLAVQIALWPLQALYFNAFTPWAVIANMAVVPLVGVAMALGASLVLAHAIAPVLLYPLSNLAWWTTSLLIAIVGRFASLPAAHIDMPPPTHAFLIAYWLALAAMAWLSVEPGRLAHYRRPIAAAAATLALLYLAPGIQAALDPRLHLDAIDVGQADCILVRAPGMHAMLVDGGGKLERAGTSGVVAQPVGDVIAQRTVMPFLLRHWVLHLDAVVLTHPHGDHAGGLPIILEREGVDALYDSAQLYGGPAYRRTLEVVRERHVRYRVARRGESFALGSSTRVDVLAPELPLITGTSSDINNNSVVLRVAFGRAAMLLTGDAQAEAEARLLAHGADDLRADILKVGHHGSAYSSTPAFLAAVRPRIAIISCGKHNMFGHPSPRTLDTLHAVGAAIYRTDLDGGITVVVPSRGASSVGVAIGGEAHRE